MKNWGRDMMNVGAGLTAGITAPLAGLGLAAFKSASDMEEALGNIRAGTGATGAALQALEKDFRAVVGTVPEDLDTVTTALTGLNQRLGLTGQPLQDMTRTMLDLAQVAKSDVAFVVESSSRLFGDWAVATGKQ